MSIRVTYLYSACVTIETADLRVVCDPWFTDGAFDGSWYQYPRLDNPLERIGAVQFIYVSHVHPDHYDPVFLRSYLTRFPEAQIIIADFRFNHLQRKMRSDGFEPRIVSTLSVGETCLDIVPNQAQATADPNDIDSALVVRRLGHSVVNMNDNPFEEHHVERICALCPKLDIALLGYTGAGPYPQTYYPDGPRVRELAERKKQEFFTRYRRMRRALNPRVAIPFAGKYLLGGKLTALNELRGVADAVEVLAFDPDAVVLGDGGDASIETETLMPSRVRTQPYSKQEVDAFLTTIRDARMAFEQVFTEDAAPFLPVRSLAPKAYCNALSKTTCKEDYYFCIAIGNAWLCVNANAENPLCEWLERPDALTPRSEVTLDVRHLFGLMTCVFHWNNAEVGSLLTVRRIPDAYNQAAQRFLNFFHV